jgi:hypothetical protein
MACPTWCVIEHDELFPIGDGFHSGPEEMHADWNRDAGEGTTDASITQLLVDDSPVTHVSVGVDADFTVEDLIVMASDLEVFARRLRAYAKDNPLEQA